MKHIDTKRPFIRELCEENVVNLVYCPTDEMGADALTKPAGPTMLRKFVDRVGLCP